MVGEACADGLDLARVFPTVGGSVAPPGTRMVGRSCIAASAIMVAGSPLSQVATPITARRVGRERIRRRNTIAASLRYGRESNMPCVPCERPSHGSLTKAANGIPPLRVISFAAACICMPISQCPVW